MKLESDGVWTVTPGHLKILEAAEKLSGSHDYVPASMLRNKASVSGNFHELILDLVSLKFITYKDKMYKLSISGLDCLAINALRRHGLQVMGSNIGIGKESDIYYGRYKGRRAAIKIHRLGRTSFKKVAERRLGEETGWFSMNKENCRREAEFLRLFSGLCVPRLLDRDRHALVMELLDFDPLYKVRVEDPEAVAAKMMSFIRQMWDMGFVHGDFNEFNVMVCDSDIVVLDFPQCIPACDPRAADYLRRDIECVHRFFWKKHFHICDHSILQDAMDSLGIQIDVERKRA